MISDRLVSQLNTDLLYITVAFLHHKPIFGNNHTNNTFLAYLHDPDIINILNLNNIRDLKVLTASNVLKYNNALVIQIESQNSIFVVKVSDWHEVYYRVILTQQVYIIFMGFGN